MADEKKRRTRLIGGVVLLQVVMLLAVFWLGVYSERHIMSMNDQGPNQPGGQVNGAPGQPPNPQQAPVAQQLPPGLTEPPQVIGHLARIDPGGFDVLTERGPRPILIDEETLFRDHEGNAIALGDLQQGYLLAIYGNPASGQQALISTEVVLLPPPLQEGQLPQQP